MSKPSVPVVAPTIGAPDVKIGTDMGAKIADAEIKRLMGVRDFQKGWLQSGSAGGGSGSGGGSGAGRLVAAWRREIRPRQVHDLPGQISGWRLELRIRQLCRT